MTSTASRPTVVRVHPGPLAGTLRAPRDKSLSHRVLILAALADGPVAVSGVSTAQDVAATARCLRGLGAEVALEDRDGALAGTVAGPLRAAGTTTLDCGNAGTAMRLLAGVAAGLAGATTLTGDASLSRRPMDRIAVPLRAMGAQVRGRGDRDLPPLTVEGGRLSGITYDSPVASAQVKSCVLLAGLAADGPTCVRSPMPSRDHTERMLRHLGADVTTTLPTDGGEEVRLRPGALGARPLQAAGDPSSGAFWIVAAAITGASLTIEDLCVNPGRIGFVGVLRQLGAALRIDGERVVCEEPVADLTTTGAALSGRAEVAGVAVVDSIDELPVLALAGALSAGGMSVRDAGELRVKESDRIDALDAAFRQLGLRLTARPDGFDVDGGQRPSGGGTVDARDDHRIAMTAAVAASVADGPVTITGFGSVPTSYPGFLEDFERLGGRYEVVHP